MKKELSTRKHPRLKGYNYSGNGAYFLTFCVKSRHEILGEVVGRDALGAPEIRLSEYGNIIKLEIEKINFYYKNVIVDKYVIMPNHIHIILLINNNDGAPRASRPTNAMIPNIIGILKRKVNKIYGFNMWQRSFHDHIIRNEEEYRQIWQYIDTNPQNWENDCYYTTTKGAE